MLRRMLLLFLVLQVPLLDIYNIHWPTYVNGFYDIRAAKRIVPVLGDGRLKRKCTGGATETLLANLSFPGGVAIGPDGAAYLSNLGVSTTAGEVLRLPVTPCP